MLSLEYIGGFFDGEGCVGYYPKHVRTKGKVYLDFYLCVKIANTNRAILEHIKTTLNLGGCLYTYKARGNHKESYALKYDNRQARSVLGRIQPYLIVKAKIVAECLAADVEGAKTAVYARPGH